MKPKEKEYKDTKKHYSSINTTIINYDISLLIQ